MRRRSCPTFPCLTRVFVPILVITFFLVWYQLRISAMSQAHKEELMVLERKYRNSFGIVRRLTDEGLMYPDKSVALRSKLRDINAFLQTEHGISSHADFLHCGSRSSVVCPERYLGSAGKAKLLLTNGTWIVEECEVAGDEWQKQVGVILDPEISPLFSDDRIAQFKQAYPQMRIFVAKSAPSIDGVHSVPIPSSTSPAAAWIQLVETAVASSSTSTHLSMLLLARDIVAPFDDFTNLRRSVRLLQDEKIGAVAGATRNSTGHWRTSCLQSSVRNFNLYLKPGYGRSECDCMLCDVVGNSAFMIRTDVIREVPLRVEHGITSAEAMFVSWLLDMKIAGFQSLVCPDLMYYVGRGEVPVITRSDWRAVTRMHRVQGVVLHHAPRMAHSFDCAEVGLSCDVYRQSEDGLLEPWCCSRSFLRILKAVDDLDKDIGLHYEISDGSALGAVKLGNYLPWDVDGELKVQTEKIHHLRPGRRGHDYLLSRGMTTGNHKEDAYWNRGMGYLKIFHNGFEFEVVGVHGRISWEYYYPEFQHPTRIQIGNLWIRTHINPGLYCRSRYGPGYLRHAQSWRFEGLETAYDAYESGTWKKPCVQPLRHDCLEKVPGDGNLWFNAHNAEL